MSKMASAGAIKFSQGRRSEAMNIPEKSEIGAAVDFTCICLTSLHIRTDKVYKDDSLKIKNRWSFKARGHHDAELVRKSSILDIFNGN